MAGEERRAFPLIPRRRSIGLPFGAVAGHRRGHGSEVIGLRDYEDGDPVSSIDWLASARLSSATGGDDFVVRQRAAEETPRVVIILDRRPTMGLYPAPLPWLNKREAQRQAATAIAASAAASRADLACLDFADGDARWLPPGRRDRPWLVAARVTHAAFGGPEDTLMRSLAFLGRRRADLPSGTFVFVLSDFLAPPPDGAWLEAAAHGWDVVPVVIQDPVWEQSWPEVAGVAVPVADPCTGRVELVRLGRRACARVRRDHEQRFAETLTRLRSLGLGPVAVDSSDSDAVDGAFLIWADDRRRSRWAR